MFPINNSILNASDSDDEWYEEELVCCHQEYDHYLCLQEEQEWAKHQARKEARATEKMRLEEEAWK